MSVQTITADAALAGLDGFDAVLDVRSPAEYALDHLPGADNWWVLDDAERARVGTLYVQVGTFEAKRLGGALIARNIARHLEAEGATWPREQRPLVYCWRGGMRSGSMAHVLGQVGWRVTLVQGGYKALRAALVTRLDAVSRAQTLRVICGPTGTGKSRLLRALERQGAQVLDLEHLAAHRGSVLGALHDRPQPSQKAFETAIWDRLRRLDPARITWVESESRKIGQLQVPAGLLEHMRASPCVRLRASPATRAAVLLGDYAALVADPAELKRRLALLTVLRGHATVARWTAMVDAGELRPLVDELLAAHYDPSYEESMQRNFAGYGAGAEWEVPGASDADFDALAARLAAAPDPVTSA